MTELENISQTDEEQAIQASIQASLKELIGDAPSPDAPSEAVAETTLTTTPETLIQEPAQDTIPAPTAEEFSQKETTESIEIPADAGTEKANDDTQEIGFEDSTQESSENFAQAAFAETTQDAADDVTGDILFEEVLDIDSIQQKLLERIYEDDPEIQTSQDVDTVIDKQAAIIEEKKAKLPVRAQSITSRKYVVYVDSENIDFMENLSIEERKEIINKLLKEQHEIAVQTKEFRKRKKYVNHTLIACLTFIIGFPIMFIMVNKSIEASMTNYQEAKQNIAKLYKQGGKVKIEQVQP